MHAVQNIQRQADRQCHVRQCRPGILIVGFDGRLGFGERELASNVRVHVAVGKVMHNLARGPAAGPVGFVKLSFREAGDRGAYVGGCGGDLVNQGAALGRGERAGTYEFADRILKVHIDDCLASAFPWAGAFDILKFRTTPFRSA